VQWVFENLKVWIVYLQVPKKPTKPVPPLPEKKQKDGGNDADKEATQASSFPSQE
jgi:hypothetical protein